mgnify:CR=1 FL=1
MIGLADASRSAAHMSSVGVSSDDPDPGLEFGEGSSRADATSPTNRLKAIVRSQRTILKLNAGVFRAAMSLSHTGKSISVPRAVLMSPRSMM